MAGLRYSVITLEGLIRTKRAAGRPKDLRALYELEALHTLRGENKREDEDEE
jgi:hypothetical protein